ncbi:hypothetical protein DSO57_1020555 [Entomophthora muscae]|uniref:Uncharacterized protein n=1 Tax=Entomophthora muscae TaxID=34485 RepID=A0ACC2SGN0_9FUNG|nr:hypothetical protein DSO57_1020555 [Entomophthora muscae]
MLTKEHKLAIRQWITQHCHLELANVQAMVKSTFGVEASISFYYHLLKKMCFSLKKLGVSSYNWNGPTNIETQKNYAEAYTAVTVHMFGGLQVGLMLAKQKFGCLLQVEA